MMGLIRARQQRQVATGKTHRVAVYACLVIVHLVLIHALQMALAPEATLAQHQIAGAPAGHASIASVEADAHDANCVVPSFVSERVGPVVIAAAISHLPAVAPELPHVQVAQGTDFDQPRRPGPSRQALLQRFTL